MASTAKEKGPAATAIAPGPVSQSQRGKENMAGNTTTPAENATISYQMSLTDACLKTLGPDQFHALYDAFTLAGEALHGIKIQPRCQQGDGGYLLNEAGDILDEMTEFFSSCANMVVQGSREAVPQSEAEAERLAWLQLRHEANMTESLVRFAVLASQMVAKANDAMWDERRRAGRAAA